MELRHPIFQYSNVATLKTINHILTHYVIVNDQLMEENVATFAEPPDFSKPIDMYYHKQEWCQLIAADGGVPISDRAMAQLLGLHLGKTGLINLEYTKWTKKPQLERT